MKDICIKLGNGLYTYYVKPLPKAIFKTIIGNWIGTTISLLIVFVLKELKKKGFKLAA